MLSSDIAALAFDTITQDDVIERLFQLVSERGVGSFVRSGADGLPNFTYIADAAHRKAATSSTCMCRYCSTIKTYVRAKIRYHNLTKGEGWDISWVSTHDDMIKLALHQLSQATIAKQLMKVELGLAEIKAPLS